MAGAPIPLARILLAYMFVLSGWQRLTDLSGLTKLLTDKQLPYPDILAYAAAIAEFGGAVLIILGLLTRLSAFALIVFTVLATVLLHDFWNMTDAAMRMANVTQFNKNLAIIGGLMLLVATGGGPLSIDAAFRRRP